MTTMHTERPSEHPPQIDADEIVEGVIVPDPKLVLHITLNRTESRALAAAAHAANMSVNRWIKETALDQAEQIRRSQGSAAD
jgi:hypothetical protein